MPSTRAASVVQAMGLDDLDLARRNRERTAPPASPKTPGKRKVSVSLAVPKALQLHKGSADATDQRFAHAHANGEAIGKLGEARHFSNSFLTIAKRRLLHPGDTKAAIDLNDALYQAGTRYAEAYEGAHLGPLRAAPVGPCMPRSTAPTVVDPAEKAAFCQRRVEEARDIVGPRLIGLVDAVVLENRTFAEVASKYGTSKNHTVAVTEARVMLVEALHMLVRHWRMYPYS